MEEQVNNSLIGNGLSNMTVTLETGVVDVRTLATDYLMYKIGE